MIDKELGKGLQDRYGRTVRDLRISVTDRCNYHCFYCKPVLTGGLKYRAGIMTYEEIVRLSSLFLSCGVQKIRLTGGEPMIRRELELLVREIANLPGLQDLAMTTNAHFLTLARARALREAGLHRLTVSLDSLRPKRFHEITGHDALTRVLRGIEAAREAGFPPLKLNTVVVRGINDDELLDFARFSRDTGNIVRFIEFMPLDADREWSRAQVVTQAEMIERLGAIGELEMIERSTNSETANKFRFVDGRGEIGVIASVSSAFCGDCSRIRLTADGKIRTCLFSQVDHDLLTRLREGASDDALRGYLEEVVLQKEPGHRINEENYTYPARSMSFIGG